MRIKCFTCGKGAWVAEFHKDILYCPYCDVPLEEV